MRVKPQTDELVPLAGVNIIPVIDVSLVLLIILLATSPILNLPGFPVKLPKAVTAESKEKNISISLSLKGDLAVNDENVNWDTLVTSLKKQLMGKKDFLVIIRADEGVTYGDVERVMGGTGNGTDQAVGGATHRDRHSAEAGNG
jgi:biopolymer transport protein ExbD